MNSNLVAILTLTIVWVYLIINSPFAQTNKVLKMCKIVYMF